MQKAALLRAAFRLVTLVLSPFFRFEPRRGIDHDSVAGLFYDVEAGFQDRVLEWIVEYSSCNCTAYFPLFLTNNKLTIS
jgi:hypothetical protein